MPKVLPKRLHTKRKLGKAKSDIQLATAASPKKTEYPREKWSHPGDAAMAVVKFAVGVSNLWRFPFLFYKNGGVMFLIPYLLAIAFGAAPVLYMEFALGQFNATGNINFWRICPMFKGVGICTTLLSFYISNYYSTLMAWATYYMIVSFSKELTMFSCNNEWNTNKCVNESTEVDKDQFKKGLQVSPATEYYEREVTELHLSSGLEHPGYPKWQLTLCLAAIYVIYFVCIGGGAKVTGKISWGGVLIPYLTLTILFVQGTLLPGAWEGVTFMLRPDPYGLASVEVWMGTLVTVFFSVGVGVGGHLTFASYNHFHRYFYRDMFVTIFIDLFTSCFATVVVFLYVGNMAHRYGWDVALIKALTNDPGQLFLVLPEAFTTLEQPHFCLVQFYLMLLVVGSGMVGALECVVTSLMDQFHEYYERAWYSRLLFSSVVIIPSFLICLINVTRGGPYWFLWFDSYSTGSSLLIGAFFQMIAVSWVYGVHQLSEDIKVMLGFMPGIYWRICWKFVSPVFVGTIAVFLMVFDERPVYKDYQYPMWSIYVGRCYSLSSIIWIPLWVVIYLCKMKGPFKQRIAFGITPERKHRSIRRRLQRGRPIMRFTRRHWFAF